MITTIRETGTAVADLEAPRPVANGGEGAAMAVVSGVLGLLGVCWVTVFGGLTVDDAFISWRYAINLVDHGIWNYNPSRIDVVEAYTNPTFAFLAILPAVLGISIEVFFKFVMAVLGIVFLVWLWRRPVTGWQRLALLTVSLANPIMHIHWWSGLETGLWIMLLTMVFAKLARDGELGWLGHGGVLLLVLTRPEGLGYLIVLVGWSLLLRRTGRQWLQAGALLLVLGVYWAARTSYFDRLLPNTFYAKTADNAKLTGLVFGMVNTALVVVAVPLLVSLLNRRGAPRIGDRAREVVMTLRSGSPESRAVWTPVVMAAVTAGVWFVVYANSNLQMNYANRFAFQLVVPLVLVCLSVPLTGARRVPAAIGLAIGAVVVAGVQAGVNENLPLVVALVGLGFGLVSVGTVGRGGRRLLIAAALAVTMSVSMMWHPASRASPQKGLEYMVWMANYRPRLQATHVEVGKVLAKYQRPGAVLVVHDAGAVPYESGWETIDVYGLASRRVTDGQLSVDDLAQINPEVVIANRLLGRSYLAKYGNRYDKIPHSTIHVLKTFDPALKADLTTTVAADLPERRLNGWQLLARHWPALEWYTGRTR